MNNSKLIAAEFNFIEGVKWVSSTVVLFGILNFIVAFSLRQCSKSLASNPNFWRFKNTFISWTHSLIASSLVIINILDCPELFNDMISTSTKFSYITICVSTGYFLYDAIDIIVSNKKLSSQSYEVLLHHFVIIGIFWVPLLTNKFVGYTLAALSIEFNTVFLHLRFMLVFNNVDKSSLIYKVVSTSNLATFLMFRILTLCWMTRWLVLNRHLVHVGWFSIGSLGLATMMVINIFLLQRLLQSDFIKSTNLNNNNNSKETIGSRQLKQDSKFLNHAHSN